MKHNTSCTHDMSRSVAMFEIETRNLPGGSVQTVNARDLHQYLEVGKDFSTWIKDRISRYGFVDGADYIVFTNSGENPSGGRPATEYHVSLDMAKELAMVERNERGRQARRYFIECERRLNASPVQYIAQMESQMIQMIEDRVDQTVALRLASSSRVAALAYVSVRELLEEHGAIQKGRTSLNRKIGARLRTRALQCRPPVELLKCPHSGVWLFPRDFAAQYMRDEGRALVSDHNAKQTGQTVMQFGPRRKGRKSNLSVVGKGETTGKGEPA
ncbi:antA/AntB antirepressor family protein [Thalassospira xiamenensis]|uniref:antA/AntB antirepressor family protein n=1 Tax=Thalassospira xiamenensis TaxID=220697 RepID=UPI003AA8BEB1